MGTNPALALSPAARAGDAAPRVLVARGVVLLRGGFAGCFGAAIIVVGPWLYGFMGTSAALAFPPATRAGDAARMVSVARGVLLRYGDGAGCSPACPAACPGPVRGAAISVVGPRQD